jgi:hypothetical protein
MVVPQEDSPPKFHMPLTCLLCPVCILLHSDNASCPV